MQSILALFRFIPPYVSPGFLAPNKTHQILKLPRMKGGQKLIFKMSLLEDDVPNCVEGFLKINYGTWEGLTLYYKNALTYSQWSNKLSHLSDIRSFFTVDKGYLLLIAKKPVSLQLYEMKDNSWI